MAGNSSLTMFKYSPSEVPIFEGEHYDYWNSEIRDFFISFDLWEIIENTYEEPPEDGSSTGWNETKQKEFKKNQKKDCTALRYIKQGKEFQGNGKVVSIKLQVLWRDFDTLLMKESEKVTEYFTRVAQIVNHIESLGDDIPEKKVIEKILRSLPPKFDHCVAAIEEANFKIIDA
ncbi:uncharacterized protein LOC142537815 [Primulina tabacum]|uniref:uncharacterized protein LOC142537815 n=1 Tax=Primulina tabacum TaxID=48773 RepID=UPI003F5A7E1C